MIDLMQFAAITSTNVAKFYNIFPQKGAVLVGSDADLFMLKPAVNHTITAVETTVSQGEVAWHEGKLNLPKIFKGRGTYIMPAPFALILYDGLEKELQREKFSQHLHRHDEHVTRKRGL